MLFPLALLALANLPFFSLMIRRSYSRCSLVLSTHYRLELAPQRLDRGELVSNLTTPSSAERLLPKLLVSVEVKWSEERLRGDRGQKIEIQKEQRERDVIRI